MNPPALALIAAPPDSLRYSLRALLARLPQIDEVRAVEDTRSLLVTLTETQPRLIVLDVNLLRDEAGLVLDRTRAAVPHTCIVVLVDQIDQQRALQATSANRVLLKGYPAADLFATLTRLLTPDDSSIDP